MSKKSKAKTIVAKEVDESVEEMSEEVEVSATLEDNEPSEEAVLEEETPETLEEDESSEEAVLEQEEASDESSKEDEESEDSETLEELSAEQEEANRFHLKRIIEAVLFASPDPVPFNKLKDVVHTVDKMKANEIKALIQELASDYEEERKAFGLEEIAQGYVLRSRPEFSPYLDQVFRNKKVERLSHSATEVLAIIAYRQPITRPQIEEIRGVDSSGVLASLMERELVEAVGKMEAPGRPTLYGTTKLFLEHYGLKDVKEMPEFVGQDNRVAIGVDETPHEDRYQKKNMEAEATAENDETDEAESAPEAKETDEAEDAIESDEAVEGAAETVEAVETSRVEASEEQAENVASEGVAETSDHEEELAEELYETTSGV